LPASYLCDDQSALGAFSASVACDSSLNGPSSASVPFINKHGE
jgi:hypothetical protein